MMKKSIALLGMVTCVVGLSAMEKRQTRHDENSANIRYYYDVSNDYTELIVAQTVLNLSSAKFDDYPLTPCIVLSFKLKSGKFVSGKLYRDNIVKKEKFKYCKLTQTFRWTWAKNDTLPNRKDSYSTLSNKCVVPEKAKLKDPNLNPYEKMEREIFLKLPRLENLLEMKEKFLKLYNSGSSKDETEENRKKRINLILNSLRD